MYSAFKASGPSEFSLLVPAWCLATGKGIPVGFLMFPASQSPDVFAAHIYICVSSAQQLRNPAWTSLPFLSSHGPTVAAVQTFPSLA